MGAQVFMEYVEGVEAETAFQTAVREAQYEYGHGGYTGTIAEKDQYVVIDGGPLSRDAAEALANRLIHSRDSRVDDRHWPAGVITVTTTGSPEVTGWLFFGWASWVRIR